MKANLKTTLLLFTLFFTASFAPAQNKGLWVAQPMGDDLSYSNYEASAGGNCLIWLERDSGDVLAYETHSHRWHRYAGHVKPQGWSNVSSAGEEVALVWDDSIAVAFNARSQSFHTLIYEGARIDDIYSHGAYASTAWFLTSEKCYVFDAHEDAWKHFAYTKPDCDPEFDLWRCRDKKDYLFFELRSSNDMNHHTLLTYSRIRRQFNELVVEHDLLHTILDKGFVFYHDDYSGNQEDYFGGYSAVTGAFKLHKPHTQIEPFATYDNNACLEPRTVYSFFYKTEVSHPEYKAHFYAFNTESGQIDSTVFNYMYSGDGLRIVMKLNGADCSVISTYVEGGDETIHYRIYSGQTSSFFTHTTDLIQSNDFPLRSLGRSVLLDNDETNLIAMDIGDQTTVQTAMPAPPVSYHHIMKTYASDGWSAATCDLYQKDTVVVYSYNAGRQTMQSFQSHSDGSYTQLNRRNILGYIPHLPTGRPFVYIYTPGTDTWHEVGVDESVSWTANRDFITFFQDGGSNVILYDGVSGARHELAYGYEHYTYTYRHLYDHFVILDTDQGGSSAYSTFTRSDASHPVNGNWKGQTGLAVCRQEHGALAYNALYNCFTPLHIDTATYAQFNYELAGDSIGFVVYEEGVLFAYDPHADSTAMGLHEQSMHGRASHFRLRQNYPNPFNASTVIRFYLPAPANIRLDVYNLLGKKVRSVLNRRLRAGEHTAIFEARGLASGVYYCRLSSETGVRLTGKMILLR